MSKPCVCAELRHSLLAAARWSIESAGESLSSGDLEGTINHLRAATKQVTEAKLAEYIGRLIARGSGAGKEAPTS